MTILKSHFVFVMFIFVAAGLAGRSDSPFFGWIDH